MARKFVPALLLVGLIGAAISVSYRTNEQNTLATAEFGGVSLRIEYAATPQAREIGLSNRASIPRDYGMLFVFPKDDYYGFWMKDTLVPLDIFWLDAKGQVVYIRGEVATSTYPAVFYPTRPARYVLETAAGFAEEHGIKIGSELLLKNPPSVTK